MPGTILRYINGRQLFVRCMLTMARVFGLQMFFSFFKTAVVLQGDGPDELDPGEHLRHSLLDLQGPQLKPFPFDEFDHYTNTH